MEQLNVVAEETAASAAVAAAAAEAAAEEAGSGRAAAQPEASGQGCQEKNDEEGLTPFLRAVRTGSPEEVARLIETHGNSVLGDFASNGRTCLHLAAERKDNSAAAAALVRLLLDGHAGRPELPHVDARDKQSFTPLHVVSFVQELCYYGRDHPPHTHTHTPHTHLLPSCRAGGKASHQHQQYPNA